MDLGWTVAGLMLLGWGWLLGRLDAESNATDRALLRLTCVALALGLVVTVWLR